MHVGVFYCILDCTLHMVLRIKDSSYFDIRNKLNIMVHRAVKDIMHSRNR